MGMYLNPGNQAFAEIADQDYVDKTSLIGLINKTIGKKNKLTCISRPRRFGKSYAAKMLTAYYDCQCDSHALFDHSAIGKYVRLEEMPSGKGLADVVFIPAPGSRLPALVIELKWNKSAGGAIEQIRQNGYSAALQPYEGNMILCGINYDAKTGKHTCEIVKM